MSAYAGVRAGQSGGMPNVAAAAAARTPPQAVASAILDTRPGAESTLAIGFDGGVWRQTSEPPLPSSPRRRGPRLPDVRDLNGGPSRVPSPHPRGESGPSPSRGRRWRGRRPRCHLPGRGAAETRGQYGTGSLGPGSRLRLGRDGGSARPTNRNSRHCAREPKQSSTCTLGRHGASRLAKTALRRSGGRFPPSDPMDGLGSAAGRVSRTPLRGAAAGGRDAILVHPARRGNARHRVRWALA